MATEFRPLTWNEAVRGFSIHVKATRAYTTYLFQYVIWPPETSAITPRPFRSTA